MICLQSIIVCQGYKKGWPDAEWPEGKQMKKGYYIHFQGRTSIGVSKKIDMQLKEFRKFYDIEEKEVETVRRNLLQRILGLFPTASIRRDYSKVLESMEQPDFIYARRAVADRAYVNFWREIKKRYPECKIIIEIFTYPYDKDDFGKWNAWPFYIKERIYRKKLKRYVDRFVTYSNDDRIFDIPTIRTTNGVDVDSIRMLSGEFPENKITMIGVAYMQRQHGYERVIEGIKDYYQKNTGEYQVFLWLVGDGPEKKKYQKLVKRYRLEKYVKFFPTTTGAELDDLYDRCDLALGSFGLYKVGYKGPLGSLKTREFLAKGIPIVTGSPINVLGDKLKYVKLFSNDSSAVDITEVIDYYEGLKKTERDKMSVARKMRKIAYDQVNVDAVMAPIIKFINDET